MSCIDLSSLSNSFQSNISVIILQIKSRPATVYQVYRKKKKTQQIFMLIEIHSIGNSLEKAIRRVKRNSRRFQIVIETVHASHINVYLFVRITPIPRARKIKQYKENKNGIKVSVPFFARFITHRDIKTTSRDI